jgi:hypothetical protein
MYLSERTEGLLWMLMTNDVENVVKVCKRACVTMFLLCFVTKMCPATSNTVRTYPINVCAVIVPLLLRKLDVVTSACRSITFDLADNSHSGVSSHAEVEAARAILKIHEFEES